MDPKSKNFFSIGLPRLTLVLMVLLQPFTTRSVFAAGPFTRASVDSSGAQSNAISYTGKISANGRYVAFDSEAGNLVSGDTNGLGDVFLRDLQLGTTVAVSANPSGSLLGGGDPAISTDGHFVAFDSGATSLVTGDTNNFQDVFVKDTQTGAVFRVSVGTGAVQSNGDSTAASISGDGRFVVFSSSATNLVAGDTNGLDDIFVHDRQTGITVRASADSSGVGANGASTGASISTDGNYVVYFSNGTNLVPGDTNGKSDVFVYALQTGQTTRVSVNSAGVQGDQLARDPSISGDGRFVTFSSYSNNLMTQDTFGYEYVYIRDRQAGTTTVASVQNGIPMIGWAESSVISSDGRYVAFSYDDKGDGIAKRWIYVHDRVTNDTVLPTVGGESDSAPSRPSISGNGQALVFTSGSTTLVSGDTNGVWDIFVAPVTFPVDLMPSVSSVANDCPGGCTGPADQVVQFTVSFSEVVTGVDAADFVLAAGGGVTGAAITGVSGTGSAYIVSVDTGTGDGTLRLDVVDDDSIKDSTLNPLGGAGAGNGAFSGPVYIVHKSIPVVTGIVRVDPNPVLADSVHYTVNFNEMVSGVDAGDFTLTSTGSVAGAVVAGVSGTDGVYTVTVNIGTGDGTLRLDVADNDSIVDVAGNPLAGVGAGNGNFTTGETYQIERNSPSVTGIVRVDVNPTTADAVRFTVTLSEAVSGVDMGDFVLNTDSLTGVSILELGGSGNIYTVTAGTGNGSGSLRLDLIDNDSIVDSVGHPLGGAGTGNGSFTVGETYTLTRNAVIPMSTDIRSTGARDGWISERNENSNTGGAKNTSGLDLKVGDDSSDRQFRAILHFPTYYLPDDAVVTQAILMIRKQRVVGTDPFTTHQNIAIDIRKGIFSSSNVLSYWTMQLTDFQAPADMYTAGVIQNNPVGDWYWAVLDSRALQFINLTDVTQLRIEFILDDNDDLGEDTIRFFSGDAPNQTDRPHLQIDYYVPRW
ncbi:MAG: hypothetical protein K8S20_10235 [Chloroflexi bacterium]|nr:hypothetical protein [Chloroflexota bacterium]